MLKLWSSVLFAFAAALLWGWSALINVPLLKSGFGTLVTVMKDGLPSSAKRLSMQRWPRYHA
jgi:hypothetical protein